MKILLLAPSKGDRAKKARASVRFPQVSLLYVAALTPPEHQVTVIEEESQPWDINAPWDLVGITCMTATAPRAYQLADNLRRRGVTVVLGGVHPSVLPEEAKLHCDAVVVGEAEPVWARLIADAQAGRLQAYYRSGTEWKLDDYPLPARAAGHVTSVMGVTPVVTSRGCPYACEFCCVRNVFGRAIRHVCVERVVQDIQASGASRVMFLDDNIVGDQAYASKLFKALRPLNIHWVGQASISFVRNTALLAEASASGCRGLFMGLESVSEQKIARMSKSMRTLEDTAAAIRRIQESGILLHASIVFGFDDDDQSIFDETVEFLQRTRVPSATFNVLTPYPGTEVYAQLKKENRLLTEDWTMYDHCTPVFIPKRMTVDQLYAGYQHVKASFFSAANIAARFPANRRTPLLFLLANVGIKMGLSTEKALMRSREAGLPLAAPRGQPA
ncbi:MAG: radical SAM protein [Spirochaetia bacterium]|jgi:radical SAM superfamily enzyme YgiQ (UPF0313 family)